MLGQGVNSREMKVKIWLSGQQGFRCGNRDPAWGLDRDVRRQAAGPDIEYIEHLRLLSDLILQGHVQLAVLLAEKLDGQLMHHGVLGKIAHELLHRAVVAVMEQQIPRLLDFQLHILNALAVGDAIAQHRLKLAER